MSLSNISTPLPSGGYNDPMPLLVSMEGTREEQAAEHAASTAAAAAAAAASDSGGGGAVFGAANLRLDALPANAPMGDVDKRVLVRRERRGRGEGV